jgi:hypothetical protein
MPAVAWVGANPIAWAGEELASDARRHNFSTRHLDWLVSDDTQDGDADDTNFATLPDPVGYGDPQFYLGVVRDSAGTLVEDRYTISWSDGRYGRSSGTYLVTPVLAGLHHTTPPTLALPPGHPDPAHVGELLDPHVRVEVPAGAFATPPTEATEDWPSVRVRMDPAAGTIRWSAALFNADNPADPLAVFNTSNTPGLVDVVMYADYTPYIMRITTDEANDDSPSAFYDLGESSRLTVFWRRSYSSTDTPHFGRTDFMHKTWTMALQVARPPITGITAITDITPSPNQPVGAANYTVDARNGIITLTECHPGRGADGVPPHYRLEQGDAGAGGYRGLRGEAGRDTGDLHDPRRVGWHGGPGALLAVLVEPAGHLRCARTGERRPAGAPVIRRLLRGGGSRVREFDPAG